MKVDNQGERNQLVIPQEPPGNLEITIKGNDNRLVIGAGCRFPRAQIEIRGDHCVIEIGEGCVLAGEFRCRDHRTVLRIGAKTTSMGLKVTMHESGTITIGDDCMFSGEVRMDTSDMHSVIDLATRQRINPPADIEIGRHVWVGYGVYLMKGTRIGAGSVIGACAVVTKAIPAHSAAAGSPARVVRKNVTWDRARLPMGKALPSAVRLVAED